MVVSLGNIDSVCYNEQIHVDERDVENYITDRIAENPQYIKTDVGSAIDNGKLVSANIKINNEYNINCANFIIGKERFGKEFDEKMMQNSGKSIINLVCDFDIDDEHKYKKALVEIDVYKISIPIEINNTNIYQLTEGQFNSVNEYKMFVKQLLYDEKKCVFDNNKLIYIESEMVKRSVFNKIPVNTINYYELNIKNYYTKLAEEKEESLEELIKEFGIDNIKEEAIYQIKKNAVLLSYFEKEGFSITQKEYQNYLKRMYQTYGEKDISLEEFEKKYKKEYLLQNMKIRIAEEALLKK